MNKKENDELKSQRQSLEHKRKKTNTIIGLCLGLGLGLPLSITTSLLVAKGCSSNKTDNTPTPVPQPEEFSVSMEGDRYIEIDKSQNETTRQYRVIINNENVSDQQITWGLVKEEDGIRIDDNGTLTITNELINDVKQIGIVVSYKKNSTYTAAFDIVLALKDEPLIIKKHIGTLNWKLQDYVWNRKDELKTQLKM